jgi:hypothetical protein
MKPLKLIALDGEDLEVISASVQDALARIGDIAWIPAEKRFVILLNRFAWETALNSTDSREFSFERRRAALHFERVEAVRRRKVRQDTQDAVLNLLAVRFNETEMPAGTIDLIFSSDAVIRLEVECIEARLCDLGPSWTTECCPDHPIEVEESVGEG